MASLYGIHLRTGCFCNMGACQRHLKLSAQRVISNFQVFIIIIIITGIFKPGLSSNATTRTTTARVSTGSISQ